MVYGFHLNLSKKMVYGFHLSVTIAFGDPKSIFYLRHVM